MTQNSNEVHVAVDGALYSFDLDATPVPVSNVSPLPDTAVDHGYFTDDGVTLTPSSTSTEITAWQKSTILRTLQTQGKIEIEGTLTQQNEPNWNLYYGTTRNPDGSYDWNPTLTGGRRNFVLDAEDEANLNHVHRWWFPLAEVTARGSIEVKTDALKLPITITAYYATQVNGNSRYFPSDGTVVS